MDKKLKLIDRLFTASIKNGKMVFEFSDHQKLSYGSAGENYPEVVLNVRNNQFFNELISKGNLGIGESYMKDFFSMSKGDLYDFLDLLLLNRVDQVIKSNPGLLLSVGMRRLQDSLRGKAHNARRHYDIGFDIFKYMLDENLTYSCGYLVNKDDSLNDLQYQKFQRILNKLQIENGDRVLDIGCGYGSFLIYAAKNYGITGVGVTNSKQHADYATQRIFEEGLSEVISITCADYRKVSGSFDKIASIGMLEHVPRSEYKAYFNLISESLSPSGSALVHAVGCNARKNEHDHFVQKYIFPNSNQPKLSEIAHHVEQTGMAIIDVENIIRHYRPTAKFWLINFLQNVDEFENKYSAEFCRCWEYYLNCCVSAARYSDSAVYQVLVHKSHLKSINYERV